MPFSNMGLLMSEVGRGMASRPRSKVSEMRCSLLTMNVYEAIIATCLALALTTASVTDVLKQKIYNWITFPAIILGFVLNGIAYHGAGLLASLEGLGVGMLWILVYALAGATSAGDVKLLMAVGALMGPRFTGLTLLCFALAGGVFGAVFALRKGVLAHTVKNTLTGLMVLGMVKSPDSLKSMAENSKAGKMPHAPAIAVGALAAWAISKHWISF